jgi:RNA polymerase sigma factor (sigma-70 family)
MQDRDDKALLQEYVELGSEEAFAALVTRHVNKVYSVALRHTGKPHEAEEITQVVFIILAKKSRKLARGVVLSGWLYHTARLASVTLIRSEVRRARRQQEAHMQTLANEIETADWPQIAPMLDAAMAELGESDRVALVLRYFDQKSMKEVGETLGATEHAAKKRVARALEKLQKYFSRRGVNSTTAVIAGVISTNAVQLAPGGLAKASAAIALAKSAAVSGSTLTLIKGVMNVMAWTKAQTAITVSVGALLIGTGAYQTHHAAKLNAQNRILQEQQAQFGQLLRQLQKEHDDATNQLAMQADEIAQNQKDNTELMRLRGEMAQLRPLQQQLVQLKAAGLAKPGGNFTNDVSGPNKVLYDFLGDPASAPPDLNRAYTKEGLTEALQSAAQNAGIVLKRIEVDDSEFPFLVGVVCDNGDYPKLKEQIAKMPDYIYSGSVGSDTCNAINITPYSLFSGQSGVTINRRLMVRQSMLYNKISGQQ